MHKQQNHASLSAKGKRINLKKNNKTNKTNPPTCFWRNKGKDFEKTGGFHLEYMFYLPNICYNVGVDPHHLGMTPVKL